MTRDKKYGPPWTILSLLGWTTDFFEKHEIPNPRFDAELLLSHCLGVDRIMLYAHFDRELDPDDLDQFRAMVKRRAGGEPIAYMLGSRGFWSIDLKTDARALIPRADSEMLVEHALRLLPPQPAMREEVVQVRVEAQEGEEEGEERVVDHVIQVPKAPGEARWHVADIGTGSGALGLAIGHAREDVLLHLSDLSAQALDLARENAQALGLLERTSFYEGHIFDPFPPKLRFALIVSNPPYIAEPERHLVSREVVDHEPHLALFAGPDGLDVLRALVPAGFERLAAGGHLLCEHGFDQRLAVTALFEDAGFKGVRTFKDFGGHDRLTLGQRPG